MTKMTKDDFRIDRYSDCSWVYFEGKAIARLKYAQKGSAGNFVKFLIAEFSREEIVEMIESDAMIGKIARERGFLPNHVIKLCKSRGYAPNKAGFEEMIKDDIAARQAA